MKTTTSVKAWAYPVTLKDHRTGEHFTDTIVIPKEWLFICGSDGLNISNDQQLIFRAYNKKGFEVLEIGQRRKVELTVDLEKLYHDQYPADPG